MPAATQSPVPKCTGRNKSPHELRAAKELHTITTRVYALPEQCLSLHLSILRCSGPGALRASDPRLLERRTRHAVLLEDAATDRARLLGFPRPACRLVRAIIELPGHQGHAECARMVFQLLGSIDVKKSSRGSPTTGLGVEKPDEDCESNTPVQGVISETLEGAPIFNNTWLVLESCCLVRGGRLPDARLCSTPDHAV